ncbi:MAG: hypothetical protein QOJ12_2998 [Thermoleophilales bacterium]|nr:hypothetical protein [Thermoleophilales bacterium]
MKTSELIGLLTIPLFSGAIGYATNWTGVWMLFEPVHFKGFKVPGLSRVAELLPRKVQDVPGIMNGGVGWQGIIPSRAAKMGSIAVDKGIAKLGQPSDFYEKLQPERLAEHIVDSSRGDIRELVDRVAAREHPQLWRELPPDLREAVHERVERQFPDIVHEVTDEIGRNIDQLLDVKLMVIRKIEERPELGNKIFKSVGDRELRFIVNFGFFFGFAMGIPVALIVYLLPQWWVLILCGTIVGWTTNWLAIKMIFEPIEARRILGFKWQGLFLRRQREVADVYADVIADDIITVANIGEELLYGASADRTRQMIASALRPAIDRAVGPVRPLVRLAVGPREYDAIRESVAVEAVDSTLTPLADEEFNREQSAEVHALIADRMREMPPRDFSEMLRSAMRQDEWLLIAHGAVLGIFGGGLHVLLFP